MGIDIKHYFQQYVSYIVVVSFSDWMLYLLMTYVRYDNFQSFPIVC